MLSREETAKRQDQIAHVEREMAKVESPPKLPPGVRKMNETWDPKSLPSIDNPAHIPSPGQNPR